MSDQDVRVLTMFLYMGVCLVLGVIAWRRTHTLGDYILGGRSLGSWVTALSAQATDMSGWLLLGLPGLAYASGFDGVWLLIGLVLGTWANWRWVAAPLREATERLSDSLTLPDYFENRFTDTGHALRILSASFILVFFIFYTSSGFVAAGRLFESVFALSYHEALLLGSTVMLAYVFLGGFLAVSWSDVLQGSLMFFALVWVAAVGISMSGGLSETFAGLEALDTSLLDPFAAEGGERLGWMGIVSLLAWGLGYAGQPHILARFMAARSAAHLRVARQVAMSWVVIVLVASVLVGLSGRLVYPVNLQGADAEKIFIEMASAFLSPTLAGICLAGVMAAIMSTASAQLLVASSALSKDFYAILKPAATPKQLLQFGRLAVLGIAACALWIAWDPGSRVLDLVAWAWAGFGAAFGPAVILSLYLPGMTRNAALAGILTGGVTVILWPRLSGLGEIFQIYELLPGFLLSLIVIVLVTRWEHASGKLRPLG